jgi:transcriptional regulator GlxA family with amidase domain
MKPNASKGTRLGFLLIDGFGLMAYTSIIEPFRAANMLANADLYQWRHLSVDGGPVRASHGVSILADGGLDDDPEFDILFVVASGDPSKIDTRAIIPWLRRLGRTAITIAAVSSAPYLLARAGLLAGYRCTIHWDYTQHMLSDFPALAFEDGLYVIDRRRITCAGGSSGLDLSIELIERAHGHRLSTLVSDWFVRTQSRTAEEHQRVSLRDRFNVSSERVLHVLAHMEANVDDPECLKVIDKVSGVTRRQIERLFHKQLGLSVGDMHRKMRLEHAHLLLRKTGMSVTEAAMASGFTSSSHFSRLFKIKFGVSPSCVRQLKRQA